MKVIIILHNFNNVMAAQFHVGKPYGVLYF